MVGLGLSSVSRVVIWLLPRNDIDCGSVGRSLGSLRSLAFSGLPLPPILPSLDFGFGTFL